MLCHWQQRFRHHLRWSSQHWQVLWWDWRNDPEELGEESSVQEDQDLWLPSNLLGRRRWRKSSQTKVLWQGNFPLPVERDHSSGAEASGRNSPKLPREQLRATLLSRTDSQHESGSGGGRQDVSLLLCQDLARPDQSCLRVKERIREQLLSEAQGQFVQKEANASDLLQSEGKRAIQRSYWMNDCRTVSGLFALTIQSPGGPYHPLWCPQYDGLPTDGHTEELGILGG